MPRSPADRSKWKAESAENLRAYGESIVINGVIGGDVELAGERIRIGPDARIAGKVEYRSGHPIEIDPQAVIAQGITEVQKDQRWLQQIGRGTPIMGMTFSFGLLLIGALMILALPRFTREAAGKLRSSPAVAAGIGCLMLIGVPFMTLLLVLTIIGIPLALLFAFGYVVLLLLGYLVAAIFLGDTVLERVGAAKLQSSGWRIAVHAAGARRDGDRPADAVRRRCRRRAAVHRGHRRVHDARVAGFPQGRGGGTAPA